MVRYNFSNIKYKNKKIEYDGIKFDSKLECERYKELKLLEKEKMIEDLRLQVRLEIVPKQPGERNVVYVADFMYFDKTLINALLKMQKVLKQKTTLSKERLLS